jgi:hypothetical protein
MTVDPATAYQQYQNFSTPAAAPTAAPAGEAGGAAAGSESSMLAAAGPWAALALAIGANETWANKEGRRPDDFKEHVGDMLTGKVLERDADALGKKVGGKAGKAIDYAGRLAHPKGAWDAGVDGLRAIQGVFT